MDSSLSPPFPGWLDPEELANFVDDLRAAGFRIGVPEYVKAQDLVLALVAKRETLDDPDRLRRLLGPLLCSSKSEQQTFGTLFEQWLERLGPKVTHDEGQETHASETFEEHVEKLERRSRSTKVALAAVGAVIVAALAYLFQVNLPRLTVKLTTPKTEVSGQFEVTVTCSEQVRQSHKRTISNS